MNEETKKAYEALDKVSKLTQHNWTFADELAHFERETEDEDMADMYFYNDMLTRAREAQMILDVILKR